MIFSPQNAKSRVFVVDFLTFISMINSTSERLKAINFFTCRYEQLEFRAKFDLSTNKFYNLGGL